MSYTNIEDFEFFEKNKPPEPRIYKIMLGRESKKTLEAAIRHKWFKHLFENRMNEYGYVECFECGKGMHEDTYKENSCCYSHLLEKSKYPQFAGDPDNVVIVHPDCHNLFTMTPKKAKNQYKQYLLLKEIYGL